MANALEAASLVMIPSGYEDGTLGSLKPTDGSGDFTFSRGSNLSATRINEQGYIEKGYENTLLASNDWAQSDSQYEITGGEAGYDGTNDAWLVNKLAAAYFSKDALVLTGVMTISFYAKAGSLDRIFVFIGGEAARFDLTNGNAVKAGGAPIAQTIELVSGTTDWYRCSITINKSVTTNLLLKPQNSLNQDVVGTIYIQDAMLNQGLVAYPYIETTTAPVAGGILEDMPRLDWSGSCPSLLLEPSRTNLLTYSEYYNGWTQSGTTLTTNTTETLSPEGLYNASKLVGNGTTGVINSGIAKTGSVAISVYLKSVSGSVNVTFKDPYGGLANEVKSVTTEWQRFDFIGDNGASFAGFWIDDIPSSGIYMWGAQLEQDATYPTSYIPTYGVSQTRLKDVLDSNADLSNYFGNGQGTFYFEFADQPYKYLSSNETINLGLRDGDYQLGLVGRSTLQFFTFTNFPTINQFINNVTGGIAVARKYLLKWNGSEVRCYVNGEFQFEFSYSVDFQPNNFGRNGGGYDNTFGELFSQMLFFPTALSDSECIALTTI